MSEDNNEMVINLFGEKVKPLNSRLGRPKFAKNKENQSIVAGLVAARFSQERIAEHIGCDPKTLREHFSRELEHGADLIMGQCIAVLIAKMQQGNIPATKQLIKLAEDGRLGPRPKIKIPKQPEEYIGVKAKRLMEAEEANKNSGFGKLRQSLSDGGKLN